MPKETYTETGRIVSINDRGFKLEGAEEWLSWSKFSPIPPEAIPDKGDTVTVTFDDRHFISHVQPVVTASLQPTRSPARASAAPSRAPARQSIRQEHSFPPPDLEEDQGFGEVRTYTDKDALICKQTSLKAAVEYYATVTSSDMATPGDVIAVADQFHRYLLGK